MEVSAEAKRIMVVALGKLYSSRSQRGGLRLHRSLLLTMVMKSCRDIYHAAQAPPETTVAPDWEQQQQQQQPGDQLVPAPAASHVQIPEAESRTLTPVEVAGPAGQDKENRCPNVPAQQQSRKRRGKAAAEPDFLPCKKAKLEQGLCPQQFHTNPVLLDYASCGSGLGPGPVPVSIQRAVAAC